MPKTTTHNAILLRPPPGTRFSILNSTDVELQFARGSEEQILTWLEWWIDNYVKPEVRAEIERRANMPPDPVAELQRKLANPGISQNEQKMAAMGMQPKAAEPHVPQYNPMPAPPRPFAHVPKPTGKMPVYGANGPMSEDEIRTLPEQPGPNGYLPVPQVNALNTSPGNNSGDEQQTDVGEGNPPNNS